MPTPAQRAQILAADLLQVVRRHKARVDWVMSVDGRVTVTVIMDTAESRTIGKILGKWWRTIWKF